MFLTNSGNGFDPLSFSKFYSNAFEDVLDVVTGLLEIVSVHITTINKQVNNHLCEANIQQHASVSPFLLQGPLNACKNNI